MAGIQLIGQQDIIAAFNDFDADTWALFEGKEYRIGGKGDESLALWLDRFAKGGSSASYKLRIYDNEELPVDSADSYIASFNVTITDTYGGMGISGHSSKLMERMDSFEKRLNGDGDDGEDIADILMGYLKNPEKLETALRAVGQFFKKGSAVPALPIQNQTMNGFSTTATRDVNDKLNRISAALDVLEKHDPDIDLHLQKLADLAEKEPLIFKGVIAKLDAL